MKRILFFLIPLLAGVAAGQAAYGLKPVPELKVVRSSSVHVAKAETDKLKQVVTGFAAEQGLSKPVQWTMPRNRKIFLPPGAFSLMYSAPKDDYYLLMRNVVGKDCVVLDVYAAGDEPAYRTLLDKLGQTIEHAMGDKAKVTPGPDCAATGT